MQSQDLTVRGALRGVSHTRLAGMGGRSMEGDVEGLYSFLGIFGGFFWGEFFLWVVGWKGWWVGKAGGLEKLARVLGTYWCVFGG